MTFSYNVSKAAVDMMTKCAALELAPYNIRVAAVAPGRVDTPMLRQYEEIGLWEHIRREQMRNEFTQPGEIADVFAFLASAESNCINGTTVCGDAIRSRKKAARSAELTSAMPCRSSTTAAGASPRRSSGTPTTATSIRKPSA